MDTRTAANLYAAIKRRVRDVMLPTILVVFLASGCDICGIFHADISYVHTYRTHTGSASTPASLDAPGDSADLPNTTDLNLLDANYQFGTTGVFTPTDIIGLPYIEQRGYLGVRVPDLSNACSPPSCNFSTIVSPTLTFAYYSPPSTTTLTTVSMPLTRRSEYVPTLDSRFPSSSNSHWEAWWIGPNEHFPMPPEPFRTSRLSTPSPVRVDFMLDFGSGSDARDCAGCALDYTLFNGFKFSELEHTVIRISGYSGKDNPLVSFDECGLPSLPTFAVLIAPSEPYTLEHCLRNFEPITRTYTLAISSSQNWDYQYTVQGLELSATPSPLAGIQITLGATYPDNAKRIFAVYTPTIGYADALRESFVISATSLISPTVQAHTYSWAFTPGYTIDEGALKVRLPFLMR